MQNTDRSHHQRTDYFLSQLEKIAVLIQEYDIGFTDAFSCVKTIDHAMTEEEYSSIKDKDSYKQFLKTLKAKSERKN